MWNLLGGFAGLISVGQQAYIGIGAYGLWFFGDELHIHPFVAVFAAAAVAALIALPIAPLLFRLRGGYFAIGTWVFAVIIMIIVSNIQATGGGSGKTVISAALLERQTRIFGTYWVGLVVAVGSILIVYLLLRSKRGLALTAIRDNTLAAQSSGVNVFTLEAHRLRRRRLRLRRHGSGGGAQPAAHPAGGFVLASTGRPTPSSSSSSAASAASRVPSSGRSSTSPCSRPSASTAPRTSCCWA